MRHRRTTLGLLASATTASLLTIPVSGVAHAEDPVQQPVFEDGMAQPVFSDDPADWVVHEGWVTADVDSDNDGERDKIHFDVTRPSETQQGLDVPVVMAASPYYAGGNPVQNHDVDHPLYVPPRPGEGRRAADAGPSIISNSLNPTWVPRGFAVVHVESIGTGGSEGCPTIGGPEETEGVKAVIDWLNGRADAVDAEGNPIDPSWTTGKVGMTGVSYNGTLPNAVASTGVEGLEAINPVAAIDSWYDYYRADGAVVAPGGYQGEDTDILFDYVYTRDDREICTPVREQLAEQQDRLTGDYSDFWDARNYQNDVDKVTAATYVVHGLRDWNVKTRHAAEWYDAVADQGVPHKIYWHQGGHGGAAPADDLNRWFTRFLYDVENGVEDEPHALVQREDRQNVQYDTWPVPGSEEVDVNLVSPGARPTGDLTLDQQRGRPFVDTFTDINTQDMAELAGAPDTDHGLVFTTPPLSEPVHLSGTPTASVRFKLGQRAANVTVGLVDLAPDGSVTRVITEGWRDPQNRHAIDRTHAVRPGVPYRMSVTMQANDYVFDPGHRIAAVVMQTEEDFTIRPPEGNTLSLDSTRSQFHLPVVGGADALAAAIG